MTNQSKTILVSDIGGTNSRFAFFRKSGNELSPEKKITLKTSAFKSFNALLEEFYNSQKENELQENELQENKLLSSIDSLVIAAAGPVSDGRYCDPPNIPWKIDLHDVFQFFPSATAHLVNDFIAQAYATVSSLAEDALVIKEGVSSKGTIAVLGPGTGLGKALLVPDEKRNIFIGVPSEGGHSNYPCENNEELALSEHIKKKHGASYATMEQFVSGDGLHSMMQHYTGLDLSPEEISHQLSSGKYPEVSTAYTRSIARICRCFALETLCTGGLFIAGGVIAKNPYLVQNNEFINIFSESDTQSDFLSKVPVSLLVSDDSGLWGAAAYSSIHAG
jgi:glucokinase